MSDSSPSGFSQWPLSLRLVAVFVGLAATMALVSLASLVLLYYPTVGGISSTAVRNDLIAACVFSACFTALYGFISSAQRTFGAR